MYCLSENLYHTLGTARLAGVQGSVCVGHEQLLCCVWPCQLQTQSKAYFSRIRTFYALVHGSALVLNVWICLHALQQAA
jgi:hypothetical protein